MGVDPTAIGKRIQVARARKQWNQSDLARALGKARQHMSQIEQGKHLPAVPLLVDIAQALNVSVDYLVGLSEEKPRKETVVHVRVQAEEEGAPRRPVRVSVVGYEDAPPRRKAASRS
jgi:transcriptional regulator with XRE-family HTH domain